MNVVDLDRRRRRWALPRRRGSWKIPRALWIGCGGVLVVLLMGLCALFWWLNRPFGGRDAATLLVIGADEPQYGRSRADTVLLVRIRLRPQRQITVVSLPRDSRVKIPGYKGYHKLNAAFALGGEALARRTVTENFGVPVDYAVVSYSSGLAAVVDALGGVEMDVPKAMDYDDTAQNLHIHLKPGRQRLNGAQAVQFVRFRKDGLGDIGRVQRQQTFLKTIAQQSLHLGLLRRWGKVEPALRQAFQTDLSSSQRLALAYCLRGLSSAEMRTATLPGRSDYLHGVSYYLPETRPVAALLEGQALSGSSPAAPGSPDNRWVVLNGSGRNGYARQAARQLQAAGLNVIQITNAPRGSYPRTQVLVASENDRHGSQNSVLRALGCGACIVTDHARPDGAQEVIIGDDFRPATGF